MKNIENVIISFDTARFTGPTPVEDVIKAEKALQLSFSDEYKVLLDKFGSLLINGEEFYGVNGDDNVVTITKEARNEDPQFPIDMYVVSNLGIDGILLLQKSDGGLYYYQFGFDVKAAANSLSDYILNL